MYTVPALPTRARSPEVGCPSPGRWRDLRRGSARTYDVSHVATPESRWPRRRPCCSWRSPCCSPRSRPSRTSLSGSVMVIFGWYGGARVAAEVDLVVGLVGRRGEEVGDVRERRRPDGERPEAVRAGAAGRRDGRDPALAAIGALPRWRRRSPTRTSRRRRRRWCRRGRGDVVRGPAAHRGCNCSRSCRSYCRRSRGWSRSCCPAARGSA